MKPRSPINRAFAWKRQRGVRRIGARDWREGGPRGRGRCDLCLDYHTKRVFLVVDATGGVVGDARGYEAGLLLPYVLLYLINPLCFVCFLHMLSGLCVYEVPVYQDDVPIKTCPPSPPPRFPSPPSHATAYLPAAVPPSRADAHGQEEIPHGGRENGLPLPPRR